MQFCDWESVCVFKECVCFRWPSPPITCSKQPTVSRGLLLGNRGGKSSKPERISLEEQDFQSILSLNQRVVLSLTSTHKRGPEKPVCVCVCVCVQCVCVCVCVCVCRCVCVCVCACVCVC